MTNFRRSQNPRMARKRPSRTSRVRRIANEEHNGWTNYETWYIKAIIDNDYDLYKKSRSKSVYSVERIIELVRFHPLNELSDSDMQKVNWSEILKDLVRERNELNGHTSHRANRSRRTARMWQEGGETLMDYEEAVAGLSLPSGSRPRIYMDYNDQILAPKSLHYLEQYLETYGEPIRYRTTSDSMDNIADWMIRPANRRANRRQPHYPRHRANRRHATINKTSLVSSEFSGMGWTNGHTGLVGHFVAYDNWLWDMVSAGTISGPKELEREFMGGRARELENMSDIDWSQVDWNDVYNFLSGK